MRRTGSQIRPLHVQACLFVPLLAAPNPMIQLDGLDGPSPTVRMAFVGQPEASDGEWISVEVEAYDGQGRIKADTTARGMKLILRLGDPNNDPVLDQIGRTEGLSIAFIDLEAAYRQWPVSRVLPATGPMSVLVRVRKLPAR